MYVAIRIARNHPFLLRKKIASVLQRALVDVLQGSASRNGMQGVLISVTKVKVTVDLSNAKVYLSIFPTGTAAELIKVPCPALKSPAKVAD